MRRILCTAILSLCLTLTGAAFARAETKVELKGVHLCCGACSAAVKNLLKGFDDVNVQCNANQKLVTITAPDDETAQKALDALAAGGFHGETGNQKLKMKDDSAVSAGKVKSLTLTGAHNCCGACCRGIKDTLKTVDGVTGDTAKPKSKTFEVTGDFDPAKVVEALNAAGFHVKVKE